MSERKLFDIVAAVEYFKSLGADAATKTFVRNLINRGQVPAARIGKKFYVRKEDLDSWITSRARKK